MKETIRRRNGERESIVFHPVREGFSPKCALLAAIFPVIDIAGRPAIHYRHGQGGNSSLSGKSKFLFFMGGR
jgi:hypothetical protein